MKTTNTTFNLNNLKTVDTQIKKDLEHKIWRETELACIKDVREEYPWDENDKIEFYFVNDLYIIYDKDSCKFYVEFTISDEEIINEEMI